MNLTEEQRNFLESQNVPLSSVFDASGLSKKEYIELMRDLEKDIAFGVSPCRKAGHTLKTRAGHCIQCDPARIAFQRRHSQSGWIYIAGSINKHFIKVGFTSDIKKRESTLRSQHYGGTSDWKIIYSSKIMKDGGQAEFQIHSALNDYFSPRTFIKSGKEIFCYEIFDCDYNTAKKALDEVLTQYESTEYFCIDDTLKYNFDGVSISEEKFKKYNKIDEIKTSTKSKGSYNKGREDKFKTPPKGNSSNIYIDEQNSEDLKHLNSSEQEKDHKLPDFGLIIFLGCFLFILIRYIFR